MTYKLIEAHTKDGESAGLWVLVDEVDGKPYVTEPGLLMSFAKETKFTPPPEALGEMLTLTVQQPAAGEYMVAMRLPNCDNEQN